MKLSDLDTIIDRRGSGCLKYDFALQRGKPADVLPFWVADMDFRVAEPIIDALQKRVAHGIFGYSESGVGYFKALAAWQRKYFHWDIQPEWLIKTPGVVPAINLAVKALTKEGEGVLINQPVYYPFLNAIIKNDRKLINSPLVLKDGHYELDFEDLENKIIENNVKLAILCSPHNPVGRVWTREELSKYAEICVRHHVKIIADEIHEDFTYPGHPHTAFGTVSEEAAQNAIICTAPSKTFNIAGLQNSNILIPNPEIRAKFQAELDAFGYDQLNVMGLAACRAAYEEGAEWLTLVKEYIRGNLDFFREYLKTNLPKLKLIEPEGTYLTWVDASAYGLSNVELEHKILYDCHLWLDMGYVFGKEGEGYLRFNLACPRVTLAQGLKQLKEGLEGSC
ncbi:MalY/PatB family protein [uncultured Dialister sp.]|uniref:MalY/PatB family protein n=1 Tax=uncultured Dialister sp. TaxID=278064 RepID=UPI0025CD853E|nr:MalY/PatB family protein [uncultured Dialister sp.]